MRRKSPSRGQGAGSPEASYRHISSGAEAAAPGRRWCQWAAQDDSSSAGSALSTQVSSAFGYRAAFELTLYAAFSSSYRFLSAAALAS